MGTSRRICSLTMPLACSLAHSHSLTHPLSSTDATRKVKNKNSKELWLGRDSFCLCAKTSLRGKPFSPYKHLFRLQVHFHVNQTRFHVNPTRFQGRLVLKQRHKVTQKCSTCIANSPAFMRKVLCSLLALNDLANWWDSSKQPTKRRSCEELRNGYIPAPTADSLTELSRRPRDLSPDCNVTRKQP